MNNLNKYKKNIIPLSMRYYGLIFLILIFTFGLYKNTEGAINNLSKITIPMNQGEIKDSYIRSTAGKSVIIIGERHDSIQVQKNIAQIIKAIINKYDQFRLIGLEGVCVNQKIESAFSDIPQNIKGLNSQEIKNLQEEIAYSLLETSEISGVEFISLLNRKVCIYGVEDIGLYEENRKLGLFSKDKPLEFQKVITQVEDKLKETLDERLNTKQREELEAKEKEINNNLLKYLQKIDGEGLGKLFKLTSDLQKEIITTKTFLSKFKKMCNKYDISFNPENSSLEEFEKSFNELHLKLQTTIKARISDEQLKNMAKIQEELEIYMSKIDKEISIFYSFLKRYRGQTCIQDNLEFLRYLQNKCLVLNISIPTSLEADIKFYKIALKRDVAITENLLKTMGKTTSSILVVGAAHICGITTEFKNRNISYIVITPKGMKGPSEGEDELYYYNLEGKTLPFSLFELWQTSNLKPPPRNLQRNFKEYERYLLIIRIIKELKAKGYSNQEISESIGSISRRYGIECDAIIYNLGDVYIPSQIGIMRLSHYSIDVNQKPVFPILKHGKIGKLFYECYNRQYFDTHKKEIIQKNNENNIASSSLNSNIIEIILKGKDNQDRWIFSDGRETKKIKNEELPQVLAGYGGGGHIPPTITISFESHPDDPFDGESWSREAQAGEFCRSIWNSNIPPYNKGLPVYITSDPRLVAKKSEEREKPIVIDNTRPNITFIDALPPDGFDLIRSQLNWFKAKGFPVEKINKFAGTSKNNITIIIGHNTEDLLNRIDGFAVKGFFKGKAVMLTVCGGFDFTKLDEKLRFLRSIDKINKQGGIVVTSFEANINDNEAGNLLQGLRNKVDEIMKGKTEALTLTDTVKEVIRERNIEPLKRSIRWDVFLLKDWNNYVVRG